MSKPRITREAFDAAVVLSASLIKGLQARTTIRAYADQCEAEIRDMEIRTLRAEIAECVNCDAEGISYSDEESECSWGCRAKRKRLAELEAER